jgi:hypothetical protein
MLNLPAQTRASSSLPSSSYESPGNEVEEMQQNYTSVVKELIMSYILFLTKVLIYGIH